MKHLFVPYEIALLAKEKGFNEPCLTAYLKNKCELLDVFDNEDLGYLSNSQLHSECIAAPIYQQLSDWFREKHDIHISISSAVLSKRCCGLIQTRSKTNSLYDNKWSNTDNEAPLTYYEALNNALIQSFNLI